MPVLSAAPFPRFSAWVMSARRLHGDPARVILRAVVDDQKFRGVRQGLAHPLHRRDDVADGSGLVVGRDQDRDVGRCGPGEAPFPPGTGGELSYTLVSYRRSAVAAVRINC